MKVFIIFSVTILFCIHYGESAVMIAPNSIDPEYPGKCVDKTNNLIMKTGETRTIPNTCTRVHCNNDFSMDYATCGLIIPPPNCHLGEIDTTKNYPACCPNIVCDD